MRELSADRPSETTSELGAEESGAGDVINDHIIAAATELIQERSSNRFTRFDGNLNHVQGLPDYAHEARTISPTRLEKYAECPRGFFVEHLLGVAPLEQPEDIITIRPIDVGTLMHSCMDQLIQQSRDEGTLPDYGRPWTNRHRAQLETITRQAATDVEAEGLTGHPLLWERERRLIAADLMAMLDADDVFRQARDARVLESELSFGRDGIDPVIIDLPDGQLRMAGSADRVDQTRDGMLLVTDIKTGSARKFKSIQQDPVVAGTKLQLPVYALAARRHFGGDRSEAMYLFARKDRNLRITLALDENLETLYTRTLSTLVRSIRAGLFPNKPPETPDFGWVQCPWCNPDGLGHDDARTSYEAKRTDPLLADLVTLIDPRAGMSAPGRAS